MNFRRKLLVGLLAIAAATVAVLVTQPEMRWRAQVVQMKLVGDLPDVELAWLVDNLRPGSPIYLKELAETGNPYAAIRNPFSSAADASAGESLFRSNCATCHGSDGHGAVVSLFAGSYVHGDSDWAIYRNVANGVDGTGMLPQPLDEKAIWQTIAYIRQQTAALTEPTAQREERLPDLRPVTFERLLNSSAEAHNWLTYSGSLNGQRFSRLAQIDRTNVARLKLAWVYQGGLHDDAVEATPIVADGVMITTEPPGTVLALDAASGRKLWRYERKLPDDLRICCGPVNRGAAISDTMVFVGTLDAHLVALDLRSGDVVWDVELAEHAHGYSHTAAPLVVNDTVVVGIAGGEFGIRGFVDAYDATSGTRRWRFNTIPDPGSEGSETWAGDSWRHGGGPTWMTGSYDAETDLIYWGVGNPGPDFNSAGRQGDNLYTNSLVALDADSGALQWHFQFTPSDVHDYDANHVPVIADVPVDGKTTRVVMSATKNGFFYVLDARSGRFISATPVTRQTWALSMGEDGRPVRDPLANPRPKGTAVYPGSGGGANWWPASFNPDLGLIYVTAKEGGGIFFSAEEEAETGELFLAGYSTAIPNEARYNVLRAIDPVKNSIVWEYSAGSFTGGSFSTATGLQFWGNSNTFHALDGATGELLWQADLGGRIVSAPMSYAVNGRQYVAVAAGRGLFVFSL